MLKFTTFLAVVCCSLTAWGWCNLRMPISQEQAFDGWIALFDDRTTFGWHPLLNDWQVVDGTLQPANHEALPLVTLSSFADAELQLEFMAKSESKAIVSLRRAKGSTKEAYRVQVAADSKSLPDNSSTVRCVTVPDEWHVLRIVLEGKQLTVEVDGEQIESQSIENIASSGQISLQVDQGMVKFRNIRLKPSSMKSLFDGNDLSAAWTEKNANKSHYEVTREGEIRVLGGEGQLETKKAYGDFILQLECYVNGQGINSGVFYRAISGKFRKIKGYESQIYNLLDPVAPDTPQKYGTGGIYLHQAARAQVACDQQWFTKTIVVSGRHAAVWVNGFQVSDWTDNRSPDENPRLGCRIEPGVICLQGHDPTTDVLFRNIRIAELPPFSE